MNLMSAHLSNTRTKIVTTILCLGMLLNSCQKDKLTPPTNVGTIRFEANAYTIENNTIDPLTIVLPLSLPLEEDATAVIKVDASSTIDASEYTIDPAIPATGLTLNLPKGSTEFSLKISSLNNFEGEKTLVLKLISATGGLTVANADATATINIKGNPIISPELKTSESSVAFGNTVTGTTSPSKSYVFTGVKLTSDVTITASSNFQVSLDDATFTNSLTIPFATANFSPITIYTKFTANTGANQTVTGTITHASGTLPDAVVSVSGVEYGVAATGVLIKKEDFNYGSSGGELITVSGGAWDSFSGTVSPILYKTTGLTYAGYAGSGVGGAITSENGSGSRQDISWLFPAQSSGTIYTAQMINFAAAPASADFFLSLGDKDSGTPAYYNRIYAKANGGQIAVGIGRNSATAVYAPTNLDPGTTYLVVHKYEFNTGVSSLYILSGTIPAVEPPTAGAISSATGDPSSMTRVVVRQNTGAPLTATIDGIRVATSWKQAVGL